MQLHTILCNTISIYKTLLQNTYKIVVHVPVNLNFNKVYIRIYASEKAETFIFDFLMSWNPYLYCIGISCIQSQGFSFGLSFLCGWAIGTRCNHGT